MTPSPPPEYDVAILTVRRPRNYLPQTLASLFASGPEVWRLAPIHLLVGDNDPGHVENFVHHRSVKVHPLAADEWQRIAPWSVHRRLIYNFWRALALPCPAALGRCVCEDDIVVRDGFFSKLRQAVEEAREREGPRFVLTAYSHYDFAAEPGRRRGRYYCSYNAAVHYGNCCLFISAALLQDLAADFYVRGVEQNEAPADLLLGQLCEERWSRGEGGMFQTVASIAQHKGVVSNGTSGAYSHSPTFDRPWPE